MALQAKDMNGLSDPYLKIYFEPIKKITKEEYFHRELLLTNIKKQQEIINANLISNKNTSPQEIYTEFAQN